MAEWVKADWSPLEATFHRGPDRFVGEKDVDQFVGDLCALCELVEGITMEDFYEANEEFFEAKEELFSSIYCLDEDNPRLDAIKELFRIPKGIAEYEYA